MKVRVARGRLAPRKRVWRNHRGGAMGREEEEEPRKKEEGGFRFLMLSRC